MKKIYLVPLAVVLLMGLMIMPAFAEFPDGFNIVEASDMVMDASDIELSGEMTYDGNLISSITEDVIEPNFGVADIGVVTTTNCFPAFSQNWGTWIGTGTDVDGFISLTGNLKSWWTCFAEVPHGAMLLGIIAEVYDNHPTDRMSLSFQLNLVGFPSVLAPPTPTPGASTAIQLLAMPINLTIDYRYGSGSVIIFDNGTLDNSFRNVFFAYQLQISPVPATATFNDVPTTHTFFREIEALVASGITGGCGGGNYCPGNNVTREQMAAFLARALGLHWTGTP